MISSDFDLRDTALKAALELRKDWETDRNVLDRSRRFYAFLTGDRETDKQPGEEQVASEKAERAGPVFIPGDRFHFNGSQYETFQEIGYAWKDEHGAPATVRFFGLPGAINQAVEKLYVAGMRARMVKRGVFTDLREGKR